MVFVLASVTQEDQVNMISFSSGLGGRVVRRCCRGVLLIWIIVGQGPIALAVGAGGVVWIFFLSSIFSFSFSLSGRRPDID